ncbi:Clavata3/esr-related 45 [Dorcoceras hygrometricum]|uniref:Clavata3/esr-related 45 n=1 Tax=Dorcoceras hygrometricum TaxID=472368 RepID=A0A2Z7A095_9LAMI|nr:Clavata3/esr-related 45 [Dorcoceras hygrometricum]
MVLYVHSAFMLFICIGLLHAFQSQDRVCASRKAGLEVEAKNPRVLEGVDASSMDLDEKPVPVGTNFDTYQSSKRRIPRGSDPIHNRT